MDDQECYAWAEIFESPWELLVEKMAARAQDLGMSQQVIDLTVIWLKEGEEQCRWVFVDDPGDIHRIRAVYNDDAHVASPTCYIVVRQPDPNDDRGEILFDIFRMNSESYLWHFNRVYTPPQR